jgi:hypothetical protein
METEIAIVTKRVGEMAVGLQLPVPRNVAEEVQKVVTIFRELRGGATLDGKTTLKSPGSTLSTAEAIAAVVGGISHATWFMGSELGAESLSSNLIGAIVKDPVQDKLVLEEYLETVLKRRKDYAGYYSTMVDML